MKRILLLIFTLVLSFPIQAFACISYPDNWFEINPSFNESQLPEVVTISQKKYTENEKGII